MERPSSETLESRAARPSIARRISATAMGGLHLLTSDTELSQDRDHDDSGDEGTAVQELEPEPPYHVFTKKQKWVVIVIIGAAGLFSGLSSNIYFLALDTIARDLNISSQIVSLTITSYLIIQGISPLIWGSISDTLGRRLIYIASFTSSIVVGPMLSGLLANFLGFRSIFIFLLILSSIITLLPKTKRSITKNGSLRLGSIYKPIIYKELEYLEDPDKPILRKKTIVTSSTTILSKELFGLRLRTIIRSAIVGKLIIKDYLEIEEEIEKLLGKNMPANNAVFTLNQTLVTDLCPKKGASTTAINNLVKCGLGAISVALINNFITTTGPSAAFLGLALVTVTIRPLARAARIREKTSNNEKA
ncbi:LOW QUALITY PROTEIN: hypothetical protein BDP67DRAFT_594252 [Colletotrichum lupini]|nr:LOW QUALITY PROTEIN: hypothetical protein BDP67DRAFT_594252 [Colletotrichum lupini]